MQENKEGKIMKEEKKNKYGYTPKLFNARSKKELRAQIRQYNDIKKVVAKHKAEEFLL